MKDGVHHFITYYKWIFKGEIGDKIVSTISAVRYPKNFAFIGYYFVLPEYRKKFMDWQF